MTYISSLISVILIIISLRIVNSSFGFFELAVAPLLFAAYFYFFKNINLNRNFGLVIFVFYIHLSLIYSPLINIIIKSNVSMDSHYAKALYLGCLLFVITIFFLTLQKKFKQIDLMATKKEFNSNGFFVLYISSIYLISALSHKLGVSPMGVPSPDLPFKLEPTLNILRTVIIPASFIVIWSSISERTYKKKILFFIFISIWIIFEIYATGSRGLLLKCTLPFVILYLTTSSLNIKNAFFLSSTMIAILLTGFLIGDYFRQHYLKAEHPKLNLLTTVNTIYYRVFPDAFLIQKFTPFLDRIDKNLYDSYRGGPNLHTYFIDEFPKNAAHNSGITALTDGYLLTGKKGLIISGILILLLFSLVDLTPKIYAIPKVLAYVYIFQLLIFADGFLSFFLYRNPLTYLAYPITLGILVFFTKTYYYSSKRSNTAKS